MRKILAVATIATAVAMVVPSQVYSACGSAVPMGHLFDGYVVCADARPLSAYAWQVNNPTTNTAFVDIICEETPALGPIGEVCSFPAAGAIGDNHVTVETDWSIPGVLGCPVISSVNQRVAVSIQCSDGTGIIISISGQDPYSSGYLLEFAAPADGSPLVAGTDNARPRVLQQSVTAGVVTAQLQFNPVRVACDCDPGSVGFASGTCVDAFVCTGSAGTVYTRVATCDSAVDGRIGAGFWTTANVTPDATGRAILVATVPTGVNQCLYVGAPTVLGGFASSGITGYIQVAGSLAASDQAIEVRATPAKGKVAIGFRTASELEAVSFDIVAKGRVVGSIQALGGNGVGASYDLSLGIGDFRGAKDFVVRTNLRNGGTKTSDTVSF